MSLLLIPDLSDLLRLHPQYNAGTVVELLRHLGAARVLWATSNDPDHPLRDALPAARISIQDLHLSDWSWADAEHEQLRSFLGQYPQGRERLNTAARAEREFAAHLQGPLTAAHLLSAEFLDTARQYHADLRTALDEGPGTRWRVRRLDEIASQLQDHQGVVLAPLDDLPELLDRLPGADWADVSTFSAGEMSRVRALADRAWQLREEDDLSALLSALDRESGDAVTPRAELDSAAASIYLAVGQLGDARTLLERAVHALNDDQPRSLAGLTLARLGQVRDAMGDRDLALRTYRAVLALSYAPRVALDAARAGLDQPFELVRDTAD
ncbi:hypothetical protein DEDE109153_00105 [Deinococcus deserti]|uniref:Tetratricopeptide repeat protein n=1 Tax=Deinococcus deserti (strain DSM 17065 / CIP 109153 / LMG 22923 / VCD115) TaxID=546414 RepID=C1CW62_DEIDV|nr:hypothetical protein [Deinococcus deserti]ACO46429.1 hypothetical protein Deide_14750 [Deinococcus deserti VCD115]